MSFKKSSTVVSKLTIFPVAPCFVPNLAQTFPDLPPFSTPLPVDIWYRDAVKELVLIEGEWQLTDTGTAVAIL